MSVVTTVTGDHVDLATPSASQITLDDIARALGNTCRWGGHVTGFYSVAEHAILVSYLLEHAGMPPPIVMAGLHHDSHEAYIGDVVTPWKTMLGDVYTRVANRLDGTIARALDVPVGVHPLGASIHREAVEWADDVALKGEDWELKISPALPDLTGKMAALCSESWPGWPHCMTGAAAAAAFRERHHELKERRGG